VNEVLFTLYKDETQWTVEGYRGLETTSTSTIFYDGKYYMFYNEKGISLATSSDGLTFEYKGLMVADDWDASVLQLPDGSLLMFYSCGSKLTAPFKPIGICTASSSDGMHWTKQGRLLEPDDKDKGQADAPEAILLPNGEIWVYYIYDWFGDNAIRLAIYNGPSFNKEDLYNLNYWTRQDLKGLFGYAIGDVDVIIISKQPLVIRMFFSYIGGSDSLNLQLPTLSGFGSALSTDGIDWIIEKGPRIPVGDLHPADPDVIKIEGGYRIYYGTYPSGSRIEDTITKLYSALSPK